MNPLKSLLNPSDPGRARIAAAAPDVVLALIFLITWIAPTALGAHTVRNLMFTIIFEFVILHSAAVVVAILLGRFDRGGGGLGILIGMSLFYLAFAGGMAYVIGAWWPLWTIAALTVNRMSTLRRSPMMAETARFQVVVSWAMTFGLYFFLIFFVHLIPWPPLGIGPEIVDALTAEASGSFVEAPQIVMVFGILYYGGVGLADWHDLNARVARRIAGNLKRSTGFFGTFFYGVYSMLFSGQPSSKRDE